MGYNHGLEKKKFDAEWKKLRRKYEEAGMSEEAIQAMYEYDCEVFNRDRAFYEHSQPIEVDGCDDESENPLLSVSENMYVSAMETDPDRQNSWVDEIENEQLHEVLILLSDDDIELLTLYVMEGFNQSEIAVMLNISQQAVAKRIAKIKVKFGA